MTFRAVLRAIRRNLIIVIVAILVCMLGGLLFSKATPATYQTETQVLFLPGATPTGTDATVAAALQSETLKVITSQVPTYAALVTTASVLDPAATTVGGGETSVTLKDRVTARLVPDTSIVAITTTASTGEAAAKLANAVSASLVQQVGQIDPSGGDSVTVTGKIVEAPVVPTTPSSPGLLISLLVGLAVGLVLAYIAVVVREALRSSERTQRA